MESKFLEFILILAHYKPQCLLKLPLPDNILLIKPDETVLVMTQEDIMKELKKENQQLRTREEQSRKQEEQLREELRKVQVLLQDKYNLFINHIT